MSRSRIRAFAALLTLLVLQSIRAYAAAPESNLFAAASKSFNDHNFERAEHEFAEFALAYTNSPLFSEALLRQGQARYHLKNFDGASQLLSSTLKAAGKLTDEYYLWLGQIAMARGGNTNYQEATEWFAKVQKEFPSSTNALEAAVQQATALSKLGQWPVLIQLLQQTNGIFQAAAKTNQTSKFVPRGDLLLSQALLAEKRYQDAEKNLERYGKLLLQDPEIRWQRQYLICRIQLADNRPEQALAGTINLLQIAVDEHLNDLRAESAAFRAGILEGLKRYDEAIIAYTNNLAEGVSIESQRQALFKITELSLFQNKLGPAAQTLQEFLARYPDAPTADLAWLSVGELRLREFLSSTNTPVTTVTSTNAPAVTNAVQQAQLAFSTLTTKFSKSPYVPKAQFNLGWCYWLTDNLAEARKAFTAASQTLALPVEQAQAYFKLGDTEFRLKDYTNAISHYETIIKRFVQPEIKSTLWEAALYQAVRASLAAGTPDLSTNAIAILLKEFPDGYHTDRAILLTGQVVNDGGNPGAARQLFAEFIQKAPNARLRPEIELAMARTLEQESKWNEAIQQYQHWVATFTNHTELPRAEYFLGWDSYRVGSETNAFATFTNLIARFPNSEFAPLAQWWVADYYNNNGKLLEAEYNYQLLGRSPGELGYQAQLAAGRVAFSRQSWSDATKYFTNLVNDAKCPQELRMQAYYAFGDTLVSQESPDTAAKLKDYQDAAAIFNTIETSASNRLAILACGSKANCLLQYVLKNQQTNELTNVIASFQKIIASNLADIKARSIAKMGIGVVLEKQNDPRKAKDQYLDVFYEKNLLHPGEQSSPFWKKKAGLDAARLAESLKEWDQAANYYRRLMTEFPELAPIVQGKILRIKQNSVAYDQHR
jgi:TolA-binding protein